MAKTKIEWCDYTINCFWGCKNGCSYCQARSLARRFGKRIGTARGYNAEIIRKMSAFEPIFLADQLAVVIKKPSRIFMSFMGEPFSPEFEEYLPLAFQYMRAFPQHTYMMLTKQPQNLAKWSPYPRNCWVGVSATDYKMFSFGLEYLADIQARVKFVSIEPILDRLNVPLLDEVLINCGINWLIIGRQTPPSKKTEPKIEWIKEIVEGADKTGVPLFLKNNLKSLLIPEDCKKPNGLMIDSLWADDKCRLRQEFPK